VAAEDLLIEKYYFSKCVKVKLWLVVIWMLSVTRLNRVLYVHIKVVCVYFESKMAAGGLSDQSAAAPAKHVRI